MALNETFKFRLTRGLARRAERARKLRMKSKSEFGREAMLEHIIRKEAELGLPPLGKKEAA